MRENPRDEALVRLRSAMLPEMVDGVVMELAAKNGYTEIVKLLKKAGVRR